MIANHLSSYKDFLENYLNEEIECFVFDSIPSTNSYLSSLAFSAKTQVCIAAQQTQGKGQHNRQWLSGKDGSILLSIRKVFSADINLNGLSLMVGLALIAVLKKYDIIGAQLKWPNDVYYQDKKLAGILIENAVQKYNQSVVIGIGVNVNVDIDCQMPWTDLHSINEKNINQLDLTKDLIETVLQFCQFFAGNGFAYFARQWVDVDYLKGKQVYYKDKKRTFSGVCCGVNNEGILLVKTVKAIEWVYSSEFLSQIRA